MDDNLFIEQAVMKPLMRDLLQAKAVRHYLPLPVGLLRGIFLGLPEDVN